jgi:putative salt-induced outer membrane protein YdiY
MHGLPPPIRHVALTITTVLFIAGAASAQTPVPAPGASTPKPWSGAISAGINMTRGNSDTMNYNVSFDVTNPVSTRNVMEATGLYLRGTSDTAKRSTGNALNVSRTSLQYWDEITLSARTFVFAEVSYLRDAFKAIDYLVSPDAGVGVKLVQGPRLKYNASAGAGSVTEKNPGLDARTSGAITLGEKLEYHVTPAATITHEATALWKTEALDDALYTFTAGLAASVSSRVQLSLTVQDIFTNRPPTAATKKNDVAVVTGLTMKF